MQYRTDLRIIPECTTNMRKVPYNSKPGNTANLIILRGSKHCSLVQVNYQVICGQRDDAGGKKYQQMLEIGRAELTYEAQCEGNVPLNLEDISNTLGLTWRIGKVTFVPAERPFGL